MWKVLVLALVVTVGAPRPAEACSCAGPSTYVFPYRETAATNTHVFVFIHEARFSENMSPFALRRSGDRDRLTVDEKTTLTGVGLRMVELIPRATLAARTKYQVVDAADKVIGTIEIGADPQTAPSGWKGIAKTEVLRWKHVGNGSCNTGATFVRLSFTGVTKSSAVYAIWFAANDGPIDYSKPPTLVDIGGDTLELGNHVSCRMFRVPFADTVRLGIVRIEYTGVRSAAVERTLDLRNPVAIDDR